MDQAISMCARKGHAARIEFDPVRVTHIPIPRGWRFVVADSGIQAHKSSGARDTYNARRAAVEHAVSRVGEHLGYPQDERTYPLLLARHRPPDLLDVAEQVLDEKHLRRFRHVVTEAERTRLAEQAMRSDAPEAFGELMNGSHHSLQGDFEVSGPELDRLVSLAREAGALGARLTGAGMGGCIVALSAPDQVEHVFQALREGYYAAAPGATSTKDLDQRLFEAIPSAGATVRRVRPR
jgi:galactokinase